MSAPTVGVGDFHFDPVTEASPSQEPQAPVPSPDLGVLSLLQGKTFKGTGFNNIFRPRSDFPLGPPVPGGPLSNDLELNLTQETITFSCPIGNVPNRGFVNQPDICLGGIMYVQSVDDVTNQITGKGDGTPTGIHIETGMWVSVPPAPESGVNVPTLCRMASIPHGTTINAQGPQPDINGAAGPPDIGPVNITPVDQNNDPQRQASQSLAGKANRIPQDLDLFNQNGTITQSILDNPVVVLNNSMAQQTITNTITWNIDTEITSGLDGGGTANIAFLSGAGATILSPGAIPNGFGAAMKATFWLETVEYAFTVQPGNDGEQMIQPNGIFGPTFVVPPTTGLTAPATITANYSQLQYRQIVTLAFKSINWPHVSVATLGETTCIPVSLPTQAA